MDFRQNSKEVSEIVFGIIGPIGCNREAVMNAFEKLAEHYSYRVCKIGMSELIKEHCKVPPYGSDQFMRVSNLMTAGSALRARSKDNSILGKLAAARIKKERSKQFDKRVIYIIDSIKHPDEVDELRSIYGVGFYLFAVHSSEKNRDNFLKNQCMISSKEKRFRLIERDKDEKVGYGQSISTAFHLADFFLTENGDQNKLWNVLQRFFDIIFADPFKTPTFHEYAMFMAYAASIKSADMSRQVGAVIAANTDIISTGANECPSPLGGTYWPIFHPENNLITDVDGGRDYTNGEDRNGKERELIVEALNKNLSAKARAQLRENIGTSGLNDLTEYGRVVHAEMDAILGCARRGVSAKGAVMFCSTHPCHNCAKHIVASGLERVIYIEPYPKSKALDMHKDSISTSIEDAGKKVLFIPFVGVGPRLFVNFFSLSLSTGEKVRRKVKDSYKKAEWKRTNALPRLKMFDTSYCTNEILVEAEARTAIAGIKKIEVMRDGSLGTQ